MRIDRPLNLNKSQVQASSMCTDQLASYKDPAHSGDAAENIISLFTTTLDSTQAEIFSADRFAQQYTRNYQPLLSLTINTCTYPRCVQRGNKKDMNSAS